MLCMTTTISRSPPTTLKSHFVKRLDPCVRTSKCVSGTKLLNTENHQLVQVHHKNNGKIDENDLISSLNISELRDALHNLRYHQIYGQGYSFLYDAVIKRVRDQLRILEIKPKVMTSNVYDEEELRRCKEELRESHIKEQENWEKELIMSEKFDSWALSEQNTEEFVSEDELLETEVRLHESIQRREKFDEKLRSFTQRLFKDTRFASRIDFF